MTVRAAITSYASGAISYEEDFSSAKDAIEHFRRQVNGIDDGLPMDGRGPDGHPDAAMLIYQQGDYDYPMAVYSVGRRRRGEWTVREED
ncbi:hypothetical protein [Micromonospora sp. NBC_01813]|uniref:hypothetical protein n=1 Tax=Micromonospora sp. NBC_01813 TaxID=2975988 RepID=UPI002DD8F5BB|nr:hypothetical protein [Micromonospora sp. NBC_01813]WSA11513.1 hypothetical protein OG958_12445 [Micromonospora sp. NBC_01813]